MIRVENLTFSYGLGPIFDSVSFSVGKGQKIGLVGPNGAGKSTLIKIVVGLLASDAGEVLRDPSCKIGYYSQEFESFDLGKIVFDLIREKAQMDEGEIRSFLARFLFDETKIFRKASSLSGGEKTRLAIACLVLQNFNLLVLDEPTTYLDPMSQRIILEALKKYRGTMILVSRTQDFIREIIPTRALFLPENKVALWSDDLLERVGEI